MCGICGWLVSETQPVDAADLDRLLQAMRHRGPDDAGTFFDQTAGVALGHNRLSIIDLTAGGHQPMVNPNNGDVLVFNGEIYNYRELRSDLESCGVRFRSHSDSEVLLMAFERWGTDCVRHIRGMFAFAVWRPANRMLYLLRDPMGIKPLYYWCLPTGGLVFASEIKAFLRLPHFTGRLNRRAIGQFLEFGYSFESQLTVLEGVRKLPPGHLLRVGQGEPPKLERYFSPDLRPDYSRSEDELVEELYETLNHVVSQHLIADVPVGLLLSGGLDSSLLAALAARNSSLKTFSMGFAESELDERAYAVRVAQHIGAEHEEILITADEVGQDLEQTVPYFDDLFADWGTISTRLLYRKCRERGIKVVLVGEGSDELFGGYGSFRLAGSKAPTELWLLQLYRYYAGRRYGSYFGAFRHIMRDALRRVDGDRFGAIRLFESQHQLPNNYVMKVDKASMSVSVEARVPFLDQRVAQFAYRTPGERLLDSWTEKKMLRDVARRYHLLPEETFTRRKFGGSMAMNWMDEQPRFRRFAQDIILGGGWTEELGLSRAMTDYFVKNRSGYGFPHPISIFSNLAWRLLILEMWSSSYGLSPHAS